MLEVILFNGAEDPEAWKEDSEKFIDDWKPCTRKFICKTFQVTYDIRICLFNVRMGDEIISFIDLECDEGLWKIRGKHSDGIFYGDISIEPIVEG